jgi:uncharacterized membrane protein YkvA (DUF1232 family)
MDAHRKNEMLAKKGFLGRLVQDFRLIGPFIKDYRSGAYPRFPLLSVFAIAFTIVYIVSPIDLIPDYLIGIGQIDDATVAGLCLYLVERDLKKYKEWKTEREKESPKNK